MKRLAAFILLLLYFATSTGATMSLHFCMGEMSNITLKGREDQQCRKCGMEKTATDLAGCCQDQHQFIKLDDDQKSDTINLEVSKLQGEMAGFGLFKELIKDFPAGYSISKSRTPFRSCENETYLLNCTFRI
jgi:hypothetical protein